MTLAFYMDEHIDPAITDGLRRRGIEVHTVQEEGQRHTPDPIILDRALTNGWVVFSMDEDFVIEARSRQGTGDPIAGVVYSVKDRWPVGKLIEDLELIAQVYEPEDISNRLEYIPLR